MKERDLSKLPKWAQDEIRLLRRDLAAANKQANEVHEPMGIHDPGVGFCRITGDQSKGFAKLDDVRWVIFNVAGLNCSMTLRGDQTQGEFVSVTFDAVDGRRTGLIRPVGSNSLDILTVPRYWHEKGKP